MNTSPVTTEFDAAYMAARKQMGVIEKSSTVGGRGSYKYAKMIDVLNVCLDPMLENDMIYEFTADFGHYTRCHYTKPDDKYGGEKHTHAYAVNQAVTLRITHVPSGQWKEYCGTGDGYDTQDKGTGKAQTYAKKYALMNAWGLASDEDPDKYASPAESEAARDAETLYNHLVSTAINGEELNAAFSDFVASDPQGDTKARVWGKFQSQAASLGLVYDKDSRTFKEVN